MLPCRLVIAAEPDILFLKMSRTFTKRDREASRYTHKLFWEANLVDGTDFFLWALTRPLALLIYNVFIPFEVAYGLQAIITRHFNSVGHYGLLVLLLGVAYCVLWGIGGVVICKNGRAGSEYIQRKVFVNYLEKDYEFFNNSYLGALGSQATRLREAFNEYCTIIMNGVTKQVVVITTSIAIIAWQSLALAVVTLISLAIIMSFTIASSKWRLKYRRLLSEASSETAGIIGDALGHGTTVKSFAAEDYEKNHLEAPLKNLGNMQFWSWMSSIPADIGRGFLATVATVVLLIMTARLYEHHTISIALVVLVQLYVIKLVMATQDIADLTKSYEAVMSSAHQAVKTMLLKPTLVDKLQTKKLSKGVKFDITMDKVTYRYSDAPKNVYAVKDFSIDIAQGEKVGLVGYSGSGKTTLTKLLLRFMDITEGSIRVGGIDIRDLAQKELRANIAYVPQEPLLFHRSIADNIAYGKPSANIKAIKNVGKTAYVDEFVGELSNQGNCVLNLPPLICWNLCLHND
jgi:ATP-binding cassette subfamily B protein